MNDFRQRLQFFLPNLGRLDNPVANVCRMHIYTYHTKYVYVIYPEHHAKASICYSLTNNEIQISSETRHSNIQTRQQLTWYSK